MTYFVYLYMVFFMILIGLVVCVVLGYAWVKFVYWLLPNPKPKTQPIQNPYIKAQILKQKNDKDYEEYLDWMAKNGSGVPFEKVMTKEEYEADRKIKKLL